MENHLRTATWINLGFGGIAVIAGLASMLMGVALGVWDGDPEIFGWLAAMGAMTAAPGLPWLIGGIGVLKGREWGRITLVALSFVVLLAIPIGTVLGWYTLWVLMNPETRRLMAIKRDGRIPALASGAVDPMPDFAEAPRAGVAEYAEQPRSAG
jgi:hypothetical protein